MGMVAYFTALSPRQLQELEDDEDGVEAFLFPQDGDSEPPNTIDLDKTWHGVHYLLTGAAGPDASPLGQAILGGSELGPDLGYGPARVLAPDEVSDVAMALALIDPDALKEQFDPDDMAVQQIYLADAFAEGGAQELGFLLDSCTRLQDFYRVAAARGDAVMLWLA